MTAETAAPRDEKGTNRLATLSIAFTQNLANSFRMIRVPEPVPSSSLEGVALG